MTSRRTRKLRKIIYGIEVLNNIDDIDACDEETGGTYWREALNKEIDKLLEYKTFCRLKKKEKNNTAF